MARFKAIGPVAFLEVRAARRHRRFPCWRNRQAASVLGTRKQPQRGWRAPSTKQKGEDRTSSPSNQSGSPQSRLPDTVQTTGLCALVLTMTSYANSLASRMAVSENSASRWLTRDRANCGTGCPQSKAAALTSSVGPDVDVALIRQCSLATRVPLAASFGRKATVKRQLIPVHAISRPDVRGRLLG